MARVMIAVLLAACAVLVAADSTLEQLQQAIEAWNKATTGKGNEYLELPEMNENYFMGVFSTYNGTLGKLSTLSLRGPEQRFTRSQGDAEFNFDLQFGLDVFSIQYEYDYSILGFSGDTGDVIFNTEVGTIRAQGTIASRGDGSCTMKKYSVDTSGLKNNSVTVTPVELRDFLKRAYGKFFADDVVPDLLPAINNALARPLQEFLCSFANSYKY